MRFEARRVDARTLPGFGRLRGNGFHYAAFDDFAVEHIFEAFEHVAGFSPTAFAMTTDDCHCAVRSGSKRASQPA